MFSTANTRSILKRKFRGVWSAPERDVEGKEEAKEGSVREANVEGIGEREGVEAGLGGDLDRSVKQPNFAENPDRIERDECCRKEHGWWLLELCR